MKNQKVIFIVDDNETYLKALKINLSEKLDFPCKLHTFSSGKELLNNMNLNPDIIVLDYFLGDFTGLELLHKIKRINPKILVVMLSVQDDVKVAVYIMNFGVFDYIHKGPVSFLKVVDSVNNANKLINSNRRMVTIKKNILYTGLAILIIGLLVGLLIKLK